MFTKSVTSPTPTLGQKMLREAMFATAVAAVFVSVRRICVGK